MFHRPHTRLLHIDCRARLPQRTFSDLLGVVKELTAGETTRGDALRCAAALLGGANADLCALFESLLLGRACA